MQRHPPLPRLRQELQALGACESGQGKTEYVIILVAISLVCVAIAATFGQKVKNLFRAPSSLPLASRLISPAPRGQAQTCGRLRRPCLRRGRFGSAIP